MQAQRSQANSDCGFRRGVGLTNTCHSPRNVGRYIG
jgi:hypothetical protein